VGAAAGDELFCQGVELFCQGDELFCQGVEPLRGGGRLMVLLFVGLLGGLLRAVAWLPGRTRSLPGGGPPVKNTPFMTSSGTCSCIAFMRQGGAGATGKGRGCIWTYRCLWFCGWTGRPLLVLELPLACREASLHAHVSCTQPDMFTGRCAFGNASSALEIAWSGNVFG